MDSVQEHFLSALADCGISMGALIAVGTVIKTEAAARLMTKRVLEAEDNGAKITDGLVLQILTDLMKEATATDND